MKNQWSYSMSAMICAVILLSIAPSTVTGQWHSGYKGRYFSGGINMQVNTFPTAPFAILGAIAQGLPVTPAIYPAVELEAAVLKRIGLGVHASSQSLGVPYKQDVVWSFKPHPASDWVSEPVPAGAFPYKWTRRGVDIFFYNNGFQSPYGRYIKLSLTRSTVSLESPQVLLKPFERDITLAEKLTFWMPSVGFGRKYLVHDRLWLGIGGQYTPDSERIKLRFHNFLEEITDTKSKSKESPYNGKESITPGYWSFGVSNDNDNSVDMRILMHQMMRLSLTMSFGFLF